MSVETPVRTQKGPDGLHIDFVPETEGNTREAPKTVEEHIAANPKLTEMKRAAVNIAEKRQREEPGESIRADEDRLEEMLVRFDEDDSLGITPELRKKIVDELIDSTARKAQDASIDKATTDSSTVEQKEAVSGANEELQAIQLKLNQLQSEMASLQSEAKNLKAQLQQALNSTGSRKQPAAVHEQAVREKKAGRLRKIGRQVAAAVALAGVGVVGVALPAGSSDSEATEHHTAEIENTVDVHSFNDDFNDDVPSEIWDFDRTDVDVEDSWERGDPLEYDTDRADELRNDRVADRAFANPVVSAIEAAEGEHTQEELDGIMSEIDDLVREVPEIRASVMANFDLLEKDVDQLDELVTEWKTDPAANGESYAELMTFLEGMEHTETYSIVSPYNSEYFLDGTDNLQLAVSYNVNHGGTAIKFVDKDGSDYHFRADCGLQPISYGQSPIEVPPERIIETPPERGITLPPPTVEVPSETPEVPDESDRPEVPDEPDEPEVPGEPEIPEEPEEPEESEPPAENDEKDFDGHIELPDEHPGDVSNEGRPVTEHPDEEGGIGNGTEGESHNSDTVEESAPGDELEIDEPDEDYAPPPVEEGANDDSGAPNTGMGGEEAPAAPQPIPPQDTQETQEPPSNENAEEDIPDLGDFVDEFIDEDTGGAAETQVASDASDARYEIGPAPETEQPLGTYPMEPEEDISLDDEVQPGDGTLPVEPPPTQ